MECTKLRVDKKIKCKGFKEHEVEVWSRGDRMCTAKETTLQRSP